MFWGVREVLEGLEGWRRIWGSIRGGGGGVVEGGFVALGFGEFGAGNFRYSKLSLRVAGIEGLIPLELANHLPIPFSQAGIKTNDIS